MKKPQGIGQINCSAIQNEIASSIRIRNSSELVFEDSVKRTGLSWVRSKIRSNLDEDRYSRTHSFLSLV